jgi:hypothetical protein
MVRGLDLFRKRFSPFSDSYIIIGGSACSVAMESSGLEFRSTKDLDIVLVAETLKPAFFTAFWDFVRDGNYEHMQRSTGKNTFYRFAKPDNPDFPFMLELFSRVPDSLEGKIAGRLTPIPADDDVSSLSAILLDESYYRFIRQGAVIVDSLSIAKPEYLIPMKAKAWLDLSERKEKGEQVDSSNISKHLKDVVSLYKILEPQTAFALAGAVRNDMITFIRKASPLSSGLGDLSRSIEHYYGLTSTEDR